MNKQDAERITTEYLKPVYGFALKRCRSLQDAEDLSQDIVLRIFTALLKREDIVDVQKYVWTIAHNCLTNYYRNNSISAEVLSTEELSGMIADNTDFESDFIIDTETAKLRTEIRTFRTEGVSLIFSCERFISKMMNILCFSIPEPDPRA